ncbi:MAG: hypothetical protein ACFFDN_34605 [Candidatus Hodarchaeota archaeon]
MIEDRNSNDALIVEYKEKKENFKNAVDSRLQKLAKNFTDKEWCKNNLSKLLYIIPYCKENKRWDDIVSLQFYLDDFLDRENYFIEYEQLLKIAKFSAEEKGDIRTLARLCNCLCVLLQRQKRYEEAYEVNQLEIQLKKELSDGEF